MCRDVSHIRALPGNRMAVCCKKHEQWELVIYNMESGQELISTMLKEGPSGMTEVIRDGTLCLALAYL